MKRICLIGIYVWMGILLSCCNHDATTLLQQAEAFLPMQFDSAQACLDAIPNPERLNTSNRSLYGLLRSVVNDRKGESLDNDSLIRPSYDYYHGTSYAGTPSDLSLLRHYAQSCYYMSLYYSSCDSTKQCEDFLRQSIKCSARCEDWHTCYLAHVFLCMNTRWSNPDYATRQALKALDIYKKVNDDVNNEVLILGHIASCYFTSSDFEKALEYYMRGYELAEEHHLLKSQNAMCMGIAGTYIHTEEHEKALGYAKQGIMTADSAVLVPSLLVLAQCYSACDSLEKAKDVLCSIPEGTSAKNKYFIFRNLSELALQTRQFDSLSMYVDSAYKNMENLFIHSHRVKDEYYQDNIAKELQKEKLQHESERNKWILGAVIVFLLLLSLFIYNVSRNRIIMERQRRLNQILTQRIELSEHLREQQEKEQVIAAHKKEIQYQNEIIRQKALTLSVMQKHLLEKLEHVAQAMSENERIKMTEEAWKEIEHLIDDTDNGFVRKLRRQHKDFKEEDFQLCMLIRLKMTNVVISNIYHIGVSAVKKRKLNLKKDGFLIADSTISLEQVIEKL